MVLSNIAIKRECLVPRRRQFGSTSQFYWLILEDLTGMKFKFVPYDGTRERMTALLSGAIQLGGLNVASGRKYLESGELKGFAIAGEDASFQMAKATHLQTGVDSRKRPQYDRSVVVLSSSLVEKPVHFRYAWARNPMANVQLPGNVDVPLATLRSDDWDLEDLAQHKGEEKANNRALRNLMKQEDLRRMRHEAEQLLSEAKESK